MSLRTLAALMLCIVVSRSLGHPVFGTKRYGRSGHHLNTWGMPAAFQPQYQYGFGIPYYSNEPVMGYPYGQDYPDNADYYYPPDPYKYPGTFHQATPPYHYGYFSYDDGSDLNDNGRDEDREHREEALPVGHEMWYENNGAAHERDSMAEVNAIFLHNLILSQMYSDAVRRGAAPYHTYGFAYPVLDEQPNEDDDADNDDWIYGDVRAQTNSDYGDDEEINEDEDVRELKSLVKKPRRVSSSGSWVRGRVAGKRGIVTPEDAVTFTDRKNSGLLRSVKTVASNDAVTTSDSPMATTAMPSVSPHAASTSTPEPQIDSRRGMKEVALLRPASPVRRPPFNTVTRSQKPRHGPSVYDTIKQLLNMEKGLRKSDGGMEDHSRPQKRFAPVRESLVQELSGLKKSA